MVDRDRLINVPSGIEGTYMIMIVIGGGP